MKKPFLYSDRWIFSLKRDTCSNVKATKTQQRKKERISVLTTYAEHFHLQSRRIGFLDLQWIPLEISNNGIISKLVYDLPDELAGSIVSIVAVINYFIEVLQSMSMTHLKRFSFLSLIYLKGNILCDFQKTNIFIGLFRRTQKLIEYGRYFILLLKTN